MEQALIQARCLPGGNRLSDFELEEFITERLADYEEARAEMPAELEPCTVRTYPLISVIRPVEGRLRADTDTILRSHTDIRGYPSVFDGILTCPYMSKEEEKKGIITKIKNGEYQLVENKNMRSKVWEDFGIIMDGDIAVLIKIFNPASQSHTCL